MTNQHDIMLTAIGTYLQETASLTARAADKINKLAEHDQHAALLLAKDVLTVLSREAETLTKLVSSLDA